MQEVEGEIFLRGLWQDLSSNGALLSLEYLLETCEYSYLTVILS